MTHVGATSIPLLLALGETGGRSAHDLLSGLAAGFAAAELLGEPVAAALSARGVRPTPVVGPIAAVVAAGRMERWDAERLRRAIGRVAAVAGGTTQAWVDGSHEWLFQIAAAGMLALSAARSSANPWRISRDPLWGEFGLFRCFGLSPDAARIPRSDHASAATRANVKRFPACAINQVPLLLLKTAMDDAPVTAEISIRLQLSLPEARYPGIARQTELDSWSARLMSLPYCMAVMAREGDFRVSDLEGAPADLSEDELRRVEVLGEAGLRVGQYVVEIGGSRTLTGSLDDFGRPRRKELAHAAAAVLGAEGVARVLALLDAAPTTSVREVAAAVVRAGG